MSRTAEVKDALKSIQSKFGKDAIAILYDTPHQDIETYSTGSIGIDKALGVGGLPRGRIIEIFGPASAGKTSVAMQVMASCQRDGGVAAMIDMESAFDPVYAKKLGIDCGKLIFAQPESGEQALQMSIELIESNAVDLIVVDSVAALVPEAELKGDVSDSHMGLQARMMGQALRKMVPLAKKNNVMIIFLNQIRMKLGITFGNPETTPGGRALPFSASVRLDVRVIGKDIDKATGEVLANKGRAKVVKNKVAAPFKQAEYLLKFNVGISIVDEMIDYGTRMGLIEQAGAWFKLGDEKFQGRKNLAAYLMENKDAYSEMYNAVTQK